VEELDYLKPQRRKYSETHEKLDLINIRNSKVLKNAKVVVVKSENLNNIDIAKNLLLNKISSLNAVVQEANKLEKKDNNKINLLDDDKGAEFTVSISVTQSVYNNNNNNSCNKSSLVNNNKILPDELTIRKETQGNEENSYILPNAPSKLKLKSCNYYDENKKNEESKSNIEVQNIPDADANMYKKNIELLVGCEEDETIFPRDLKKDTKTRIQYEEVKQE